MNNFWYAVHDHAEKPWEQLPPHVREAFEKVPLLQVFKWADLSAEQRLSLSELHGQSLDLDRIESRVFDAAVVRSEIKKWYDEAVKDRDFPGQAAYRRVLDRIAALESEPEPTKPKRAFHTDELPPPGALRVVAALVEVLKVHAGKGFPSQRAIEDAIMDKVGAVKGLSRSTVQKVLAVANKPLEEL